MWRMIVILSMLSVLAIVPISALAQMPDAQAQEYSLKSDQTSSTPVNENIILAKENMNSRCVSVSESHSHVIFQRLHRGESTGEETHRIDQILLFVAGQGELILNGKKNPVILNRFFFIPAGVKHNLINTGKTDLALYTVYARTDYRPNTNDQIKVKN